MLTLSNIAIQLGGRLLLDRFDLTVSPGEITVLLGRSGIGKTTVLRLAAELLRPNSGTIVNSFRRTSYVFQEPRLLPWSSALDNVALALDPLERSRRRRRAEAELWLTRLGFEPRDFGKYPAQLSGGMQSRVAIARALIVKPELVLMDEPFAALDFPLRRQLQALTRDLCRAQNTAALFVTHDLAETAAIADRVAVMGGSPAQVLSSFAQAPTPSLPELWVAVAELAQRGELRGVFDPPARHAISR